MDQKAREIEIQRHTQASPWTYAHLDQRQMEIASRARQGGPGALLLSEVAPVITLGRRAGEADLLRAREEIRSQGIEVYETDRVGLSTYHGPGQLVLFAVDRLERLTGDPRGVRRAVEGLLEVLLITARVYEPRAEVRQGSQLGIWSPRGKLGAAGIQVAQGVLHHGAALNGFKTPQSFQGLRPCGLDAPVDFLIPTPDEGAFRAIGDRLLAASDRVFWKG